MIYRDILQNKNNYFNSLYIKVSNLLQVIQKTNLYHFLVSNTNSTIKNNIILISNISYVITHQIDFTNQDNLYCYENNKFKIDNKNYLGKNNSRDIL